MEVKFSPDTEARLNRAAAENGSGSAEYVQQFVEHYLDYDEWFRRKVKTGLDQLDEGRFLTHEEVGAWIEAAHWHASP